MSGGETDGKQIVCGVAGQFHGLFGPFGGETRITDHAADQTADGLGGINVMCVIGFRSSVGQPMLGHIVFKGIPEGHLRCLPIGAGFGGISVSAGEGFGLKKGSCTDEMLRLLRDFSHRFHLQCDKSGRNVRPDGSQRCGGLIRIEGVLLPVAVDGCKTIFITVLDKGKLE